MGDERNKRARRDEKVLDAHTHLTEDVFDPDREAVIHRAVGCGVDRFLSCGTSEADWERVASLAGAERRVLPAFGLHPWFVGGRSPQWKDRLVGFLGNAPSSVGEIGLDGIMDNPPEEAAQVFTEQLELAERFAVPASIHCVHAWGPLLQAIRPFAGKIPMLIHAFGGSVEMLRQLEQLGCHFSFGCAVLDLKRKRPGAAAMAVRLDRLLLESDAPTLPPPKESRPPWMQLDAYGKARNEPAIVPTVLETIAELRGMSREELAAATDENGRRFCGDRPHT